MSTGGFTRTYICPVCKGDGSCRDNSYIGGCKNYLTILQEIDDRRQEAKAMARRINSRKQ